MKTSRSEFITVRGLRHHIRHWGSADAPALFLLHGWMDVSASIQFVVDELTHDWHVIAPDWRGFGLSAAPGTDTYWFPDYLGDLDGIVRHYAASGPIDLLGHSMGANLAMLYAGIRPQKIRRLINLEGFGMAASQPQRAPARYAQWLDSLLQPPTMRPYASAAAVAARLQKTNPRLPDERARFLATEWAQPDETGAWHILADPVHKANGPLLYQADEVLACWQCITAPVLWVEAADTDAWRWLGDRQQARAEIERRLQFIAQLRTEVVADAGHMLHHDQPQRLAALIEDFLVPPP